MGGGDSKLNPNSHLGSLRIQLDNHEVVSGGELRGTIGLLVNEQISLDTLHIEFTGEQAVHFTGVGMKVGRQSLPISHDDNKVIACFSKPLFVWPDRVINPGQYTLPFSLKIPEGIPSTLNWSVMKHIRNSLLPDSETTAKVNYKVAVWLMPGIQDQVSIAVHQREGLPSYETSFDRRSEVTYWCSSKGTISLNMKLDKGTYFVGEDVRVAMTLDTTQAQIKPIGFSAELRYRMHLQTTFGSDITSGIIDTTSTTVDSKAGAQDLILCLRLNPDRCGTLSTLQSDMIKCEFFIVVNPLNDSCCVCYDDISSDMKIVVNARIPHPPAPVPPPGWAPTELQVSKVEYGHQDSKAAPLAPPLS
jgi:hypothetical protein